MSYLRKMINNNNNFSSLLRDVQFLSFFFFFFFFVFLVIKMDQTLISFNFAIRTSLYVYANT